MITEQQSFSVWTSELRIITVTYDAQLHPVVQTCYCRKIHFLKFLFQNKTNFKLLHITIIIIIISLWFYKHVCVLSLFFSWWEHLQKFIRAILSDNTDQLYIVTETQIHTTSNFRVKTDNQIEKWSLTITLNDTLMYRSSDTRCKYHKNINR